MSIKLMTQVWDRSPLDGSRLLILLAMADMANDEGYCWPSYATLAKRARLKSRQNVIKIMNEFIEAGIVEKKGRVDDEGNQTSNMYHVIAGNINKEIPSTTSGTSVNTDTTPSVNTDTPLVSVLTPESSFNHQLEPSDDDSAQKQKNIFQFYSENIGPLTPFISDALQDAEKRYPANWIEAAFKIAVERNARNWKYIDAILRDWGIRGFMAPKPGATYAHKQPAIAQRKTPYVHQTPEQIEAMRKQMSDPANEADWDEWIANRKKESVNA